MTNFNAAAEGGDQFRTSGAIRLLGAHIRGQLVLNGSDLGHNQNNLSLRAGRLQVDGGMFATVAAGERFRAVRDRSGAGAHWRPVGLERCGFSWTLRGAGSA